MSNPTNIAEDCMAGRGDGAGPGRTYDTMLEEGELKVSFRSTGVARLSQKTYFYKGVSSANGEYRLSPRADHRCVSGAGEGLASQSFGGKLSMGGKKKIQPELSAPPATAQRSC